jgi:hypothetical protein
MSEISIIDGRHKCRRKMDMRIVDVKDDDGDIFAWIIYGICKKCKVVLVCDLIMQSEEPMLGRDLIIDYNKIAKEATSCEDMDKELNKNP